MKRTTCFFVRQLGLFAMVLCLSLPGRSQGWPPVAATYPDLDPTGGSAAVHHNKRINIDMFGYYATGATHMRPDANLIVYAFDDVPGGTSLPSVRLVVWDVGVPTGAGLPKDDPCLTKAAGL